MTVLLLCGPEAASPLALARSFGRHTSVLVATLDDVPTPAAASRWVDAAERFDDGRRGLRDALLWARATSSFQTTVIPCTDALVETVAEHRSELEDGDVLWLCPDPELALRLVDKAASFELAEKAGLSLPAWAVDTVPDGLAPSDQVIIRPRRHDTSGPEPFKLRVAAGGDAEQVVSELVSEGAGIVAQRMLRPQSRATAFAVIAADHGRMLTCVTGWKHLEASADGGVLVTGRLERLPALEEQARKYLAATGFHGFGGLEFIRFGGGWWFIEFNPRVEAIQFVVQAAGLDSASAYLPGGSALALQQADDAPLLVGAALLERVRHCGVDSEVRREVLRVMARRHATPVWRWSDPLPGLVMLQRILRGAIRTGVTRR